MMEYSDDDAASCELSEQLVVCSSSGRNVNSSSSDRLENEEDVIDAERTQIWSPYTTFSHGNHESDPPRSSHILFAQADALFACLMPQSFQVPMPQLYFTMSEPLHSLASESGHVSRGSWERGWNNLLPFCRPLHRLRLSVAFFCLAPAAKLSSFSFSFLLCLPFFLQTSL